MIRHKLRKKAEIFYSKKFLLAFGIAFVLVSIWEFYHFSVKEENTDYSINLNDSSRIISIHIPRNLNFAGEKVPVYDFKIKRAIEKEFVELMYWRPQTTLLQKRAARWFPLIEAILKQHNIPDDFKYIALIESKLSNVVSPKGATGFWQFVESSANRYNLEITQDVDERYHVIKSTHAACNYFKEAYKEFNNWTLTAASYNRGIDGIKNQLKKQKQDEFYSLKLTRETNRYIYKLLAMKEILSRPKVYGFNENRNYKFHYPKTKKITIDSTITDLNAFAQKTGSNIHLIKAINPWLTSDKLYNPENKKYIIEVPINTNSIYDTDGNLIEVITHTVDKTDSTQQKDSLPLH